MKRYRKAVEGLKHSVLLVLMVWTVCAMCAACLKPTSRAEAQDEPTIEPALTETVESVPEVKAETIATVEPIVEATEETVEELVAHTYFNIPLSAELQDFIVDACEEHHIEASVVVAIIQKESNFAANAKGDNGNSLGLMQIQGRYQKDRMDQLGCDDLLDPFQNVAVGIDILAELVDYYDGNLEMALMAYNAGQTGAYNYWFSQGIYSNSYSRTVLSYAKDLMEGLIEHEPILQ